MEKKWYFAQDFGEKEYLSDGLSEVFRTKGDGPDALKGIAREVIQNSIDAKRETLTAPLVVKFEFIEIDREEFPDLNGLLSHIEGTINFLNQKNKKNVALSTSVKQQNILKKDLFYILKISDFNTKGVSGSTNLDSGTSKWKGLVYNDGDTIKDNFNSLGSFGLGKNASFAISQLRTVFYVTRDLENNYAMEGVAKLYTSFVNEKKQINEGYFCNCIDGKTTPLNEEQAISISPIFKREDIGTDVLIFEPNIALFKGKEKWYLIESIISNFFMAFINGEIEVIVDSIEINQAQLFKVFDRLWRFYEDNDEPISPKLICVKQYLETIEYGEDCSDYLDFYGLIFLKLFKTPETKFKKVAIFREHGMLIKEYDVNSANQKFSGVLVVKGEEGIKFLKSIEDPSHSDFDPSRENDDSTLSQAVRKSRLKSFYEWISTKARIFTHIDSTGSIALFGMEDYIQMPENGSLINKEKREITVRKIKRSSRKEKERIYEKTNVREEEFGMDTPSEEHNISSKVVDKPNPNDYEPETKNRVFDNESKKKGLIKLYSASFSIPPVMKYDDSQCVIIYRTTVEDKKLRMKIVAIGEDGKENNLLPKLVEAYDLNNDVYLIIKDYVINDISSNGITKLLLKFDNRINCRIKAYVYWEELI